MPQTVLLTLGRLPKAIELVRAFASAGYRVIIAEPHRWHLSRVSNQVARCYQVTPPVTDARAYLDELLRIVVDEQVSLVVPVSEETMHAAALKARLPSGVRMFCPDQPVLLALHDKQRFIELAEAAGLTVPRTFALTDPKARELSATQDFVVKPRFSCSGRGVQLLKKGDALPVLGEPAVVQQFIAGQVMSTFSIAREGQVLVTAVYQGSVMSGTVSVCFERVEHPGITRWVEAFVAARRHDGFISFDFVVDAQGTAFAIECNPRVTSGAHFVESAFIASAILQREGPRPAPFRQNRLSQQFYPTLTETQKSVFSPSFKKNFRFLTQARDVVWDWKDPLPFLTMPLTAWRILSYAIFNKTSLGEASTYDIEWYGETGVPAVIEARAKAG
jgi:predicted ATP-grasp superfamily ATP-dependent carboligase